MIHSPARITGLLLALAVFAAPLARAATAPAKTPPAAELSMDQMWGATTVLPGLGSSDRVALFRDGNYGMFIHWGIYSHLGGQWRGQTFYGIGEWIKRQMRISEPDYMALAKEFNPTAFDAREIVRVAKAAGMKWIIITSKHHDGFAMFKSAHPFNIVDASPFHRDPMKELAAACKKAGLGFGFYYSHNQDWTAPGGNNGPKQGVKLQNQQNSSPIYHSHRFGLLTFKTPGPHTIAVSLVDGPPDKASLQAIRLSPVQ